jgi:predicted phosphodiesterase
MRFIHAADIHLDSPLAGLRERAQDRASHIADASRSAFKSLVSYALRERVDFVLIAGDIFDGDCADYKSALFLVGQLARLDQAGIRVVMIRGNHDAANRMSQALTWPERVKELPSKAPDKVVLEDLGVVVHGQSFATREVTHNLVPRYPERVPGMFNIGLLHSSVDGRPGHSSYAPCTIHDLRSKGYDYWALGHVHGHEILDRDPYVVFPGNLQGRHANECGPKGFVAVTVEGNKVVALEHVPMDVVRWARIEVDVSGALDIGGVCPRVFSALRAAADDAEGRTLAVRIVLKGACPAHLALAGDPSRLLAECTSIALQCSGDIWIEKVVVQTAEPADRGIGESGAVVAGLLERIRANKAEADAVISPLKLGFDKLPAEVREAMDLGDAEEARGSLLAAAEALVLHRLSGGGRAA